MFKRKSPPDAVELPSTVAPASSQVRYFEAFGRPLLKLQRRELADLLHWLVTLVLLVVLYRMAQPTVAVPFLIEANPETGETYLSRRAAREFNPALINKTYEARRWVRLVWTGNAATTEADLRAAAAMTSGAAVGELTRFLLAEQPAARWVTDPTWTRDVEILSSNPISDKGTDMVLVRAKLTDSKAGTRVIIVTVQYVLIPPKSAEEADRVNPIGLRVTHFTFTDEAK
ncbi:VirB8/TrbF family protein [Chitinimonas koreensis]|uniref:VirB8/TrbF family protein n=1 Tax=Chitinimonas koreensis TaxID=356302 RepID=UPI0003FAC527|nr:VirB8/TrbF family protein [Chitinimonas koreensis]QNM95525.1 hypothetical protein H9L41_16865 [Chitinimonas koreensis]